jgi:hypothetical protein
MQYQLKTSKKASRSKLLNVKVTQFEYDMIKSLADKHAGGNKSVWIRYAAIHFRPKKADLVPVDDTDENSPMIIGGD